MANDTTTSATDTSAADADLQLSPPKPAPAPKPDPHIGSLGKREHWKPRPVLPLDLTLEKLFNWKSAPAYLGPNVFLKLRHDENGRMHTLIQLANQAVIKDTGQTLELRHTRHKPADWRTLEAAVLLAADRFGTVNAFGADDFVMRAWAVAERNGLHITVQPELQSLFQSYKQLHSGRLQSEAAKSLGPVDETILQQRALARASADKLSEEEAKAAKDKAERELVMNLANDLKATMAEQQAIRTDIAAVTQSKQAIDEVLAAKSKKEHRREPRHDAPGGGHKP